MGNSQLGVNYAGSASQGGAATTALVANLATNASALGGVAPSGYAPASGSTNYVAKAGDTMTGALNVPADGLQVGSNQIITSGGNVGIGTTNPSAPLHVVGQTIAANTSVVSATQSGSISTSFSPSALPPAAVTGTATSTTGSAAGVVGTIQNPNGAGVLGLSTDPTGGVGVA
ncbi:MAG: hypothetical protein DMG24_14520, partial [Acidobacteria bacterium]